MSGTTARLAITVIAGAGLCGAALALSPLATATPFKTGGYECIEDAAGTVGDPVVAAICAPVADMAGIPLALPGPIPAGAAAVGVPLPVGAAAVPAVIPPVPAVVPPVPAVVPPVPVGVPPVPVGVPPVPVGVPPVPVGAAALGVPVPAGVGNPLLLGAPILDMSGLGGKGVPTGPPPAGGPLPGQPIPPGPTG